MPVLAGIHPVREALLAGHPIDRLLVSKGAGGPKLQEIVDLARKAKILIRFEDRAVLDKAAGSVPHQGVVALGGTQKYVDFDSAAEKSDLVVILDGVEDPHNLGAIIRTAHAAGAGAVIIPERRAVGVTEIVAKASAGAIAHLPVVRVVNIGNAIDDCKKRGYWIYGLDERGEHQYDQIEYTRPTAIVMGGEGHGLHEHVKKRCDFLVRIPMAGAIASLNVSVATGVVLFEWRRQLSKQP